MKKIKEWDEFDWLTFWGAVFIAIIIGFYTFVIIFKP